MKFLLFSKSGEGCGVLDRISKEGNDTCVYIQDKSYKSVFDGILEKTNNPDRFIDKNTIIIFDMSGNGKIADEYRRKGHLVYGAGEFHDKLEHDREFGFEIMQKAGIKIPKYETFTDFESGLNYVQSSAVALLVFKPSGNMPCKLTYIAKEKKELTEYMKFVRNKFEKHIKSFVLQEFIKGEVVSSEFFCGGENFLWPPNQTVETKKFMNDDLGPSTGCSGNITWTDFNDIIKNGVMKLEDICIREELIGQIDLNTVVSDNGVYGLEFTPRFGYDATPTLLTLLNIDYGELFYGVASGELEEIDIKDKYAGSIRLTIPPYPVEPQGKTDTEEISPNEGIPILNTKEYEDNIYFYEVCKKDGGMVHSSGTGVILLGLGKGNTPEESLELPEEIMENVIVPDKQYRTDICDVLCDSIEELENLKEEKYA